MTDLDVVVNHALDELNDLVDDIANSAYSAGLVANVGTVTVVRRAGRGLGEAEPYRGTSATSAAPPEILSAATGEAVMELAQARTPTIVLKETMLTGLGNEGIDEIEGVYVFG